MPYIILNSLLSILGMLIASNFSSAFGTNAVPEFLVISALCAAVLAQPMVASTLAFLITATCADLLMSGPPGVPAFFGILIYLFIRLLTLRLQPQRFVSISIIALVSTFLYHAVLAGVYTLYFRDAPFFTIFLHNDWICALLTALLAPIMIWLTNRLGALFEKRKQGGLIV